MYMLFMPLVCDKELSKADTTTFNLRMSALLITYTSPQPQARACGTPQLESIINLWYSAVHIAYNFVQTLKHL